MFLGAFRYLLVNLVIIGHLQPGLMLYPGYLAVFGFFVISGFFVTYSLNKNYGFSFAGILKYLKNRIIRIYPTYLIILFFSLIIVLLLPETSKALNHYQILPENLVSWLKNVFIIGLGRFFGENRETHRLVEIGWFLHLILIFYIVVPILGKNVKRAYWWCVASFIVFVYYCLTNNRVTIDYNAIHLASFPFSLGSLLYYFNKHKNKIVKKILNPKFFYVILLLFLLLILVVDYCIYIYKILILVNLALISLIILFLKNYNFKKSIKKYKFIDNLLGDISYPMFLCHWQIAVLIAYFFFDGLVLNRYSSERVFLYLVALPFINIFSIIVAAIVNRFTKKMRDNNRLKIKEKSI